jgi:hypothetical protein
MQSREIQRQRAFLLEGKVQGISGSLEAPGEVPEKWSPPYRHSMGAHR